MRVLIAAGGTAGHVVPALAVADVLRAEGAEVIWAGGERAEAELVPAAGYPFHRLRVEGVSRSNPLRGARALGRAGAATFTARRLVAGLRPAAVLGGGGYVAAPVGVAAVLGHVHLVLTEADSHLGLANRLLAPFARRVCLAFPLPGREGGRYLVTGRPAPVAHTDRASARAAFGLGADEPCVLVFGGSLGARSLNWVAPQAFARPPPRVIHAAGERDFPELRAPGPHYDLRAYISPFGPALAACDLVVARAGGSLFEVAAHGRPAVLVPYPHATADHQASNAQWMQRGGAAVVIPDAELDPGRLRAEVDRLLGDPVRLAAMAAASLALARPDAARAVAAEVLAAAGAR